MYRRKSMLVLSLALLGVKSFSNEVDEKNKNHKISEKPVTLSILAIQNGKVFDENWLIFKEAFKDTNVKLESATSKNLTDEVQAFNLTVSSGNLPDIISYAYPDKIENLGMAGGMVSLNDLIDKHAPNIKEFFEKYPRYKMDAVAADGKIYYIPCYYDWYAMKASQGLFIRKDWLDKLGLQVPENMDDFYKVLKAFREQDPNGNGKADEIPYFDRTVEFATKELVGLFGAEYGFYIENGIVKYGPTEERFKEAMPEVIKWYKEGLVDPEIYTRGFSGRDYMLRNDVGGVTFDWFASTAGYNNDEELKKQNEKFEFVAIAPPKYKGKSYAPDARTTSLGGWGISASAKDPVVIIKYMDYWFSDKGYELYNWGVEGDTFAKNENGEKYYTDKVMKAPGKNALQVLRDNGLQFKMGARQDYEYEKAWGDSKATEWSEMYMKNGYIMDQVPLFKYTPEEAKKVQKINSQITMTLDEMSQKWVLGAEDFDKSYEKFIERINKLGLKELIEINQKAFDRVQS
ncbi:extracellular solute-binding protein [uncultured Cetobacterium sp.]|uniref:extracellular solute-binding protein n=1 Tax=uncultured Cetobacterium sp. TaxID=527638 RepID=UPI0026073C48|nr:extracellular solute-binding protein [uncultured Cetobacterium sp.]